MKPGEETDAIRATSVGTPKAGTFAERAAKIVAASIIAEMDKTERVPSYAGDGSCYIEFGEGKVGRVDINFFSGPFPKGKLYDPSETLSKEKSGYEISHRMRWFGL